ncbi:hypothetical protein BLA15816_04280 [Burkholderia lata]|nr:hypothetical protein BLA15816_04280 [Burkholderia lata]
MIVTFLKALELGDTDRVLESFKKTGTGGLHRFPVTISSTAGGAFSVASLAASAHPTAKAALSAAQVVLTALTTRLAFSSAELRVRNAGTEEVMPLGRADSTPSAKTGPNLLIASSRLIWHLRKVSTNVAQMERAKDALDDARSRLAKADASLEARQLAMQDARAAEEKLSIAFARFCLRNELKSEYKTAAESAKIEYHGNRRYLGMSVASGALSVTSTLLGIITPVVITSSAVTAGATGAAVALTALLYLGYQLSTGPSKDGEEKAKRAIIALVKSLDLLAGNAVSQQKARAGAYRTYLAEKRTSFNAAERAQAKRKLLDTLDEIAQDDTTKNDLDPLKNWLDYTRLLRDVAAAGDNTADVEALEQAFVQAHSSQFKSSTVIDAWKTPERMRFDSMGRILLGKVSESIASLHAFNDKAARAASRDSRLEAMSRAQALAGRRTDLKASLLDWISFELAQSRMKSALSDKDPMVARASLRAAGAALAAIENSNARALYSADGRKQVEATELSKRMTIGEIERYTMTNAGPAALAGLVNLGGAAASLGLNIEKQIELGHGIHSRPQFGDQNDARVLAQSSAPITAPYTAAERARFQKTSMGKLVDTIARKGDPVVAKLDLPGANTMVPDLGDRLVDIKLEKLLAEIEATRDIPDEITVCINGKKLSSGKLSGTTAYYQWRYENASLGRKVRFQSRQLTMLASSIAVSVVPPIVQTLAQIPLSMTRGAVDRGKTLSFDVRKQLTDLKELRSDDATTGIVGETPAQANRAADQMDGTVQSALVGKSARIAETEVTNRVSASFDPSAAAHALAVIPLLGTGFGAKLAAAQPGAIFRPRPATLTHPVGETARQQEMMSRQGAAETQRWFEANGIEAAYNSGGASMDCLIISLLQHASGHYELQHEPQLVAIATRYRTALGQAHPEIDAGDRMLYDDEPAVATLMEMINRDYGVSMDLHLVLPTIDGPVRIQSAGTGSDPVGIVIFGNHYQALHRAGGTPKQLTPHVVTTVKSTATGSANAEAQQGTAPQTATPSAQAPLVSKAPNETIPASRADPGSKIEVSVRRVEAWLADHYAGPPTMQNREPPPLGPQRGAPRGKMEASRHRVEALLSDIPSHPQKATTRGQISPPAQQIKADGSTGASPDLPTQADGNFGAQSMHRVETRRANVLWSRMPREIVPQPTRSEQPIARPTSAPSSNGKRRWTQRLRFDVKSLFRITNKNR